MIVRTILLLLYGLAFQFAYLDYLFPTFSYASFRNADQSYIDNIVNLLLIASPSIFFRDSPSPSAFGAALLYIVIYAPAQIMIPRMLDDIYYPTLFIQLMLAISMSAMCFFSRKGVINENCSYSFSKETVNVIFGISVVFLLALVATNYQHMRFVEFADVYDLRADSSISAQIPILAYTNLWLSYCLLPFFIARGILQRERLSLGFGFLGCFLIYLATGAKAQILLPLIMLGIYFISRQTKLTFSHLVAINLVLVLLTFTFPSEGPLATAKSLYLMRTLSTGGLTISLYYEFFSSYGYTYYTHINLIGPIIGSYPYGQYSMGQVIGLEYFNSDLANYNANFWASDGFAAMGLAGIPLITGIVCAFLYTLNRLASFFDLRFVSLWLTGFWLAMLNLPFTTAILSGGGLLTLFLLSVSRLQNNASHNRRDVAPRKQSAAVGNFKSLS